MSVLGWELAGADAAFLQPVSVLTLYEFLVPATRDRDTIMSSGPPSEEG